MYSRLIFHVNFVGDPFYSQVFFKAALSEVLNSKAIRSETAMIGASFGCFLAPLFRLPWLRDRLVSLSKNPFFLEARACDPFEIEDSNKVATISVPFSSQESLARVVDLSTNGGTPLGDDDIVVILGHGDGSTISFFDFAMGEFVRAFANRAIAERTRTLARNWFTSLLSLQSVSMRLTTTDIAKGLGANRPGLIILHSCYAGTLEFAYGLRYAGKHLLASPANLLVRDIGYREWLDKFYANTIPNIVASATHLVDSARRDGGKLALLVLYDLSKLELLKASLTSFVSAAKNALAQGSIDRRVLVNAMNCCYPFELPNTAVKAIDLHQFGINAGSIFELATDAKALCAAVKACVVARSNDGNGTVSGSDYPDGVIGLSIILPKEAYLPDSLYLGSTDLESQLLEANFPLAFSTGWLSLLQHGGSG